MKQLKGAGINALAKLASACAQAADDRPKPDDNGKSASKVSLDREPPAFAAYVTPAQKAAALADDGKRNLDWAPHFERSWEHVARFIGVTLTPGR